MMLEVPVCDGLSLWASRDGEKFQTSLALNI